MQEAVKYYQSFFTDGISDKAAPATPTTEPDFVSGKVPMFISGPWEMSAVEKVGGKGFKDKYSVAVMPDEEDVVLLRRWLRLRGLQGLQAARHGLEVREVPLRPQDAGRSGTSSRPTCPRSPSAWKDPSISADTKLAKFGEQLETAQAPPSFPTWEQVVGAVRHRDGEGHQAGQRPGGRAEVRADAGRSRSGPARPRDHHRARALPRGDGPDRWAGTAARTGRGRPAARDVPPGSSPCRSACCSSTFTMWPVVQSLFMSFTDTRATRPAGTRSRST